MYDTMRPAQKVVFADAARLASINLRIQKHIGNNTIHVTKEDKERWNSAATREDIEQLQAEIDELRSLINNG